MRIRFSNGFLFFCGTTTGIINLFYPSIFGSFVFGGCFGLIYLNYKERKQ